VLRLRHGWSYFDFKITLNMAARASGHVRLFQFPGPGMCRAYLRSMKRYRRWLGLDHVTYVDEIFRPNDAILFEKAGFDYPTRRGGFEEWETPVGLDSLDRYLGSKETRDESIFDQVVTVESLGDFDFTVSAFNKRWRIAYRVLSYTANVYLKL
jgi:hypothetical protein